MLILGVGKGKKIIHILEYTADGVVIEWEVASIRVRLQFDSHDYIGDENIGELEEQDPNGVQHSFRFPRYKSFNLKPGTDGMAVVSGWFCMCGMG